MKIDNEMCLGIDVQEASSNGESLQDRADRIRRILAEKILAKKGAKVFNELDKTENEDEMGLKGSLEADARYKQINEIAFHPIVEVMLSEIEQHIRQQLRKSEDGYAITIEGTEYITSEVSTTHVDMMTALSETNSELSSLSDKPEDNAEAIDKIVEIGAQRIVNVLLSTNDDADLKLSGYSVCFKIWWDPRAGLSMSVIESGKTTEVEDFDHLFEIVAEILSRKSDFLATGRRIEREKQATTNLIIKILRS